MHINDLIVRALLGSYNVPGQYFRGKTLEGSVVDLSPGAEVDLVSGAQVGVVPGITTARILVDNTLVGGISTTSVVVGITPMLLPEVALTNRRHISLYNLAAETVYLGGASVSIANGLPLPAGSPYSADMSDTTLLYSIAGISNCDVRVMEVA